MNHFAFFRQTSVCALAASTVLAITLPVTSAFAQDGLEKLWRAPSGIVTEFSVGVMNGKAQEFVYNPGGSKLSQLDWRFDNVAMFNAAATYQLLPWLKLGLKGSMNLTDSSTMDDYDFNLPGFCPPPDFTCHSHHPDTKLRQARTWDVYGQADFFRRGGLTVSALAGYKDTYYKWAAIGGTANYAVLPPGLGISYEQSWSTPYIGIAFSSTHDAWTLSGRIIGSTWAKGDDKDNHHLRALQFTEKYSGTNMIAGDIGVAYRVNRFVSVTADYRYERWCTAKGPTTITDTITGGTTFVPGDAAGANAETHALSLGIKVDLQPAHAAPSHKDSAPSAVAMWTGWGFGVGGGYDWQRSDWRTTQLAAGGFGVFGDTANVGFDDSGRRASVFVGHTWQSGGIVYGIEGDLGKSNASKTHLAIPGTLPLGIVALGISDSTIVSSGVDGSLRARVGVLATPSLLLYATGGVAFQQTKAAVSCPDDAVASWCLAGGKFEEKAKWTVGWTAGAGYEMAFAGNWFTRGEYRYTSTGSFDHTFFAATPVDDVSATIDTSSHRLTFSLGYRY